MSTSNGSRTSPTSLLSRWTRLSRVASLSVLLERTRSRSLDLSICRTSTIRFSRFSSRSNRLSLMISWLPSRVSATKCYPFNSMWFWRTRKLRSRHIVLIKLVVRQLTWMVWRSRFSASTWSSSSKKFSTVSSVLTIPWSHKHRLVGFNLRPHPTLTSVNHLFTWVSSLSKALHSLLLLDKLFKRHVTWQRWKMLKLLTSTRQWWQLAPAIDMRTRTVFITCAPTLPTSSSLTLSLKASLKNSWSGSVAVV